MADARSIPHAVLWHEGMLLSPHHFQQSELRGHAMRQYLLEAIAPFGWGVKHLRIDTAALETGRLAVTELEAIMPDGLPVVFPEAGTISGPALEVDLRPWADGATANGIAVHLATGALTAMPDRLSASQKARYRQLASEEVVDANTGDNPISIPRLTPHLTLEVTALPSERPAPDRLVSLPLMVLRANGAGFVRSESYEPPRLCVEEATLLFQEAKGVESALAGKANDWAGRLHGAMAEGLAAEVRENIVLLSTIVRGLPRLAALLKTRVAHPFDVYLALCDIAGDLAVAGGELINPDFDGYAHADPLAAYRRVAKFVREALEKLRTPYTSLAFERSGAGVFELTLEAGYLRDPQVVREIRQRLVIGARVRRTQQVEAVRRWFGAARIGAAEDIALLGLNRSAGAAREEIPSAPELGLLPQPHMILFSVVEPEVLSKGQALVISLTPEEARSAELSEPDQIVFFVRIPDPNPGAQES